jgi:hypothetical protein
VPVAAVMLRSRAARRELRKTAGGGGYPSARRSTARSRQAEGSENSILLRRHGIRQSAQIQASRAESLDLAQRGLRCGEDDAEVLATTGFVLGYFGEDINDGKGPLKRGSAVA